MMTMTLSQAATIYLAAGLCVLPAAPTQKRPTVATWRVYQSHLPGEAELAAWLTTAEGVCIVCGSVSGNLEMIDFDLGGAAFKPWMDLVQALSPGLFERLVVETTPSGGRHVVYRCETPVSGNAKLASREFEAEDENPITIGAKDYRPVRKTDGRMAATVVMIETRGEGGLFLCDPTPGYAVVQGDMATPPLLSTDERETLLRAARSLDEIQPHDEIQSHNEGQLVWSPTMSAGRRPGDAFNAAADPRPDLLRHGWVLVRSGDNEHWRRPGKDAGTSATLKNGVFYVFSSNAPPFEPGKGYSPFAVYAMLNHGGDFKMAALALGNAGYGDRAHFQSNGVDLSAFKISGATNNAGGMNLSAFFGPEPASIADELKFVPVGELVAAYPRLREPVIHGLLREGETMNIIAAPKTGKSWLTLDLAIAVATGRPWLGRYPTEHGQVAIVDNELHRETSADRLPKVAASRGVSMTEISEQIVINNVRGHLVDINALACNLCTLDPGRFKVIILDAFYRFMPAGGDENDNAGMAQIYNTLDRVADYLHCCFVLIHHSSKGNQSGKSVTDIGAGAGAQSRATDTHLVLRPHEEDGVVVLDAAVRSWPPIDPVCLRWDFPVWSVDETLDPDHISGKATPKTKQTEQERVWTTREFVEMFLDDEQPINKAEAWARCKGEPGLTLRKVRDLIDKAVGEKIVAIVSKEEGRGGKRGFVRVNKENNPWLNL